MKKDTFHITRLARQMWNTVTGGTPLSEVDFSWILTEASLTRSCAVQPAIGIRRTSTTIVPVAQSYDSLASVGPCRRCSCRFRGTTPTMGILARPQVGRRRRARVRVWAHHRLHRARPPAIPRTRTACRLWGKFGTRPRPNATPGVPGTRFGKSRRARVSAANTVCPCCALCAGSTSDVA